MKKIPTLFKRDFTNAGKITREYADGVEWVWRGEGIATRKYDGTSVLIRNGKMYKRYEVKQGRAAPPDFEEVDFDQETGKRVGWVEVGWGPEEQWHRAAIEGGDPDKVDLPDGTYELVGPKVQGNPERFEKHTLVQHSGEQALNRNVPYVETLDGVPTDYEGLRAWFEGKDIEGVVWHHPEGKMAKIKKKDFGLKR